MQSTLTRLEQWYAAQCDGDWEHSSGIKIESLDNPGWLIRINLAGTSLENLAFAPLRQGLENRDGLMHPSASDWHSISVKEKTFEAAGDAAKLEFMLTTFLNWAEGTGR